MLNNLPRVILLMTDVGLEPSPDFTPFYLPLLSQPQVYGEGLDNMICQYLWRTYYHKLEVMQNLEFQLTYYYKLYYN